MTHVRLASLFLVNLLIIQCSALASATDADSESAENAFPTSCPQIKEHPCSVESDQVIDDGTGKDEGHVTKEQFRYDIGKHLSNKRNLNRKPYEELLDNLGAKERFPSGQILRATSLLEDADCQNGFRAQSAKSKSCREKLISRLQDLSIARFGFQKPEWMKVDLEDAGANGILNHPELLKLDDRLYDKFTRVVVDTGKKMNSNLKSEAKEMFIDVKEIAKEVAAEVISSKSHLEEAIRRIDGALFDEDPNCPGKGLTSYAGLAINRGGNGNTSRQTWVKLCDGNFFAKNSIFGVLFSMSHEVGHTFDPRGITGASRFRNPFNQTSNDRYLPYKDIVRCLRDAKSLGAAPKASALSWMGLFDFEGDQITESFADFVAVEIMARYLQKKQKVMEDKFGKLKPQQIGRGLVNAFRDLGCDKEEDGGPHPSGRARYERIALAHPWFRKKIGCEPDKAGPPAPLYCGKFKDGESERVEQESEKLRK